MTIAQLEQFFIENPVRQMRLNNHTFIVDFKKFVQAHLCYLKSNPKNMTYVSYYNRLVEAKNIVSQASESTN